ncbi:MAG: TetR/AcrR family transcriptional regulator [Demequinaceae bacterium]|nr:TetR/AcrR family transcriptional regulator [Demequinaceae bacterium]
MASPLDPSGQPAARGRGAEGGYPKGRAKRAEVIQAAIVSIAESGFHGASLRDIAARAGISHAGLLHHFPTKAHLLRAVLEHRDEVDGADIDEDVTRGSSFIEATLRLAERNARRRPMVEAFAVLAAEATTPEHPAHAYFSAHYARAIALAAAGFRELKEAGRLRPEVDPEIEGRQWIALWDGLQIQWLQSLAEPSVAPLDTAAELRYRLDSLLVTPPRAR